jgi:predicted nucleic acid-binding protein
MNIVDSSGWLEFFADGPNADAFAPIVRKTRELIVPTLSLYEVFKRILQQKDEGQALRAIAIMMQGTVVELNTTTALSAAKISASTKLPMADSVMLATARAFRAMLWTQDADFKGMEEVRYIPFGR